MEHTQPSARHVSCMHPTFKLAGQFLSPASHDGWHSMHGQLNPSLRTLEAGSIVQIDTGHQCIMSITNVS